MEKSKLQNMMVRAASGAVYVALMVGCTLAGGQWFIGLMLLLTILGMTELQRLLSSRARIISVARVLDVVTGISVLTLLMMTTGLSHVMAVLTVVAAILILYVPLRIIIAVADRSAAPAKSVLFSLLTIAYIAVPLTLLGLAMVAGDARIAKNIILITFILIWVNDTGAYLTGMSMGKHKMCERLSPKKTWEGFWGGFTLCVVAGASLCYFMLEISTVTLIAGAVYAAIVSVVGTYGDLFESLIKRTLGVKDSGNLIPGHGGILDRIDSILAVAPLTLIFMIVNEIIK